MKHLIYYKCIVCGKEKGVYPCRIKSQKLKYCSPQCVGIARREYANEQEKRLAKNQRFRVYCQRYPERHRASALKSYLKKHNKTCIRPKGRKIHIMKGDSNKTYYMFKCKECGKVQWKSSQRESVRMFCSHKCVADSHRIYQNKQESKKAYRMRHPEKRIKNKGITKEAFEKIKARQGYKCALCGRQEPFLEQYWHYLTQDHIIPRSLGGRKRSKENIQAVCWDCNIKKSNKMPEGLTSEFISNSIKV